MPLVRQRTALCSAGSEEHWGCSALHQDLYVGPIRGGWKHAALAAWLVIATMLQRRAHPKCSLPA